LETLSNKNKINLITLGCSKNIVDSERILRQLEINDFDIVNNAEEADTVIINTCGFIEAAKEESINTILQAIEAKKAGSIDKVLVAGCLSERYKEELRDEIPEVDEYFGTEKYQDIVETLGGEFKYELLGERELTTPKHFAYLKISEGCDNPCSFCAIPLIRGGFRSKSIEELKKETEFLAQQGVKELIIIGQDTTDYGKDIYGKRNLHELLRELASVEGIEWIRLLYAYPSHFPNEVIEEIANNKKVLNYLDLPLQHISDSVLKSMRRGISSSRQRELVSRIKNGIPDLTFRTTFIVGYPTETDEDFEELYDFVKESKFDRVGVFTYSQEDNTYSYDLGDPIPEEVKEARKEALMELQKEISLEKNKTMLGKKIKCIVDDIEGKYFVARSVKDAPEVDGNVLIDSQDRMLHVGNFYDVEVVDFNEYDLFAIPTNGK
jgi:ribosomal protein S12 methylthiotransferase